MVEPRGARLVEAGRAARRSARTSWEQIRANRGRYRLRSAGAGAANVVTSLAGLTSSRVRCPCCGWTGAAFLVTAGERQLSWGAACPRCSSRRRHRAIALLLGDLAGEMPDAPEMLHFAPEPVLSDLLSAAFPEAHVVTTDRFRTDVDLPGQDVQRLGIAAHTFDLVLCNHVLEHVPDDEAAVAELARVTRPSGVAIITVPGTWTDQETETFAELDRNGHHRHYGLDTSSLLEGAFDQVQVMSGALIAHGGDPHASGLDPAEPVFLCRP